MNRKKALIGIVLAAIALLALLSIPAPDPPLAEGVAGKPFTWKQDANWNALETSFRQARHIGCAGLKEPIDGGFRQGGLYLATLAASRFAPDAPIFTELEKDIFSLGTSVAACPERLPEYIDLVTRTRSMLKKQLEYWDMNDRSARNRLYRLIYGGRAALEEVMAGGDGRNGGAAEPGGVGDARSDQGESARPGSGLPAKAGLQAPLLGPGPHGQHGLD